METQSFEFGEFFLDTREKVLLRNQKPLAITPKAFLLLQTLVENHGHILAKEQLMESVWADSFVEDGNLTFTINAVRKALADDRHHPRYIETIPKRGYRFIAPVVQFEDAKPSDVISEQPPPALEIKTASSRLPRYLVPVFSAIVIGLCAAGLWYATSSESGPNAPILLTSFNSEKLPTSGNSEYAVISPDGKHAAYTDESGGKQSIWLRHLDKAESVQIVPPSNDVYFGLAFSSGGDSLLFIRKPVEGHDLPALYKISTFGGVPVKILENVIYTVSSSPDDKQIAFVRCRYKKDDFCSLNIADSNGGNERKLLTTEASLHIFDSRFAQDGKSIAFSWGQTANDKNEFKLSEINIESGEQREISPERFFEIRTLQWLPDGAGLLFSANDHLDGKYSIWATSIASGTSRRLTKDAASYSRISLDRTAGRMIAVQSEPDFKINVIAGGTTKTLTNARDFMFSSDGRIVYSTYDGEIWMVNRNGAEQRQLTNNAFAESSPRISSDGKSIYFSSNEGGSIQIWRMNADGTDRKQITTTTGGSPQFITPDRRYIYYISAITSRLYKVSLENGLETLVNEKKLHGAAISPDGNLLAYFFLDNGFKVAIRKTEDPEILKVFDLGDGYWSERGLAWSADSKTLYYIVESDGNNLLWQQSLDEAKPHLVADLGDEEIESIAIAPNDNAVGYIRGNWNYDVVLLRGLK